MHVPVRRVLRNLCRRGGRARCDMMRSVFVVLSVCYCCLGGGVIIALLGAWLFLFSWCVIVVSRWGAVFTRDGSSCCSQPLIVTDELLKATTDMSGATLVIQLSF